MNKHHIFVLPSILVTASFIFGGCIGSEPGDEQEATTEAEPSDEQEATTEAELAGQGTAVLSDLSVTESPDDEYRTTDDMAAAVTRKHWSCTSPSGSKFNLSYSPGSNSTTFYFNNHCNQKRSFRVYLVDGVDHSMGSKCYTVNPHTNGSKRVWHIAERVSRVTSPSHC